MDAAQANVELVIPQERQKIGAHLRHGKKVCAEYVALLPTSEGEPVRREMGVPEQQRVAGCSG